jgi:uncharacterized protein (DUF433 family)
LRLAPSNPVKRRLKIGHVPATPELLSCHVWLRCSTASQSIPTCFGKPCIKGTRIWVSLVLDFLASGETLEQIRAIYPQLTDDDIRAAIAYGAELARERVIPVPVTPAA